jgi:hypothetical protein
MMIPIVAIVTTFAFPVALVATFKRQHSFHRCGGSMSTARDPRVPAGEAAIEATIAAPRGVAL